jgi:SAM-dependent methyltransferase
MPPDAEPEAPPRPSLPVRALRALWRLAADGPHRGVVWLKLRRPPGAFQPVNTTFENRYPRVFAHARFRLGREFAGRILSFGCSTGEEAFWLRRYFPGAVIKGLDINPGNIALARARLARMADDGISFEIAGSTRDEPTGSYDAIFCMAVFRHEALADGSQRCDHLLRFDDFAATVADLARCLRPGGLLAIRHSNFRFRDAPVSADFEPVLTAPLIPGRTPLFGPDNRLLDPVAEEDAVFLKKA